MDPKDFSTWYDEIPLPSPSTEMQKPATTKTQQQKNVESYLHY